MLYLLKESTKKPFAKIQHRRNDSTIKMRYKTWSQFYFKVGERLLESKKSYIKLAVEHQTTLFRVDI